MRRIHITKATLARTVDPILSFMPQFYLVDCTSKLNLAQFQRDAAFFESHKNRRLLIREANHNEFDAVEDIGDFMQLPMMSVLVIQLARGKHSCALVYFGRKYRNVPMNSDEDVTQVLWRMDRDKGCDRTEIDEFYAQVVRNTEAFTAALTSNQKAN